MAICPFAVWTPFTGPSGSHLGGPFKIVHHSTEGATAEGAFSAYRAKRCDPHFTVDNSRIYQHIDTALGARALRNEPGGVQTNRDSAIQIELVGFAHLPKSPDALRLVARLCRWLEATHGIPSVWPAGPPKPAKNGRDPGGHNRDAGIWDAQGGHYGHCHVPENTHWDPGYTSDEAAFVLNATFSESGRLLGGATKGRRHPTAKRATPNKSAKSTMPDHAEVPVGTVAYIRDLTLSRSGGLVLPVSRGKAKRGSKATRRAASSAAQGSAVVNTGSVLSFVAGVSPAEAQDVLDSVQLAQRGASGAYDRVMETRQWYQKYLEILENVGWTTEQFAFSRFDQEEGEFRMDQAALGVVAAIATQNQLAVLKGAIDALEKLAESDGAIALFDQQASAEGGGNFQLGAVSRSDTGTLAMALGAYHFKGADHRRKFLFFRWGSRRIHLWTAAQRMTLNPDLYAANRAAVAAALQADSAEYLSRLTLKRQN